MRSGKRCVLATSRAVPARNQPLPAHAGRSVSAPPIGLGGSFARRLQDIESDTGYDTRRRVPEGALDGVSQTAVCDTGGSAPPASQRRMAPVGSYSLMRVLFPPWTDGSAHHCFRSRSKPSSKPGSSCSTLVIPNSSARSRALRVSSRYASFAGSSGLSLKSSKTAWQRSTCPLRQGAGVEHGKFENRP